MDLEFLDLESHKDSILVYVYSNKNKDTITMFTGMYTGMG